MGNKSPSLCDSGSQQETWHTKSRAGREGLSRGSIYKGVGREQGVRGGEDLKGAKARWPVHNVMGQRVSYMKRTLNTQNWELLFTEK